MWPIFSVIGGIAKSLFGGGGNSSFAEKVMDKVLPETEKEKQAAALAAEAQVNDEVKDARAFQQADMPTIQYQPGMGLIPFILMWTLDLINHVVDTVNHIIRPGFFIYLIGGFMKKWPLPDPDAVDPRLWQIFLVVVTFYFGARMIVKDLPETIRAIKGK